MYPRKDLSVFIFMLSIASPVGAKTKSKFVVTTNKRICAMHYGEVTQSLAACSAVCQSSSDCAGAKYFAGTRTCHLFNKPCYLTEETIGWTYLSRSHRTFLYIANMADTWDGAKTYCESIGGDLANIYTQTDYDMVLSVIGQSLDQTGVWLGGSDIQKEGEWVWSNGCRFNDQVFSAWLPNEPNNLDDQDCLRIWKATGNTGWDDMWCEGYYLNFVCEVTIT